MSSKIELSRELIDRIVRDGCLSVATHDQLRQALDAPVVERQPVPITEGANRLMEAYRFGEFRLEGGSPTVEAMSCQSFDENEASLREHDFDSYSAGYQSAMYEQAKTLLHLCTAPPELAELQATIARQEQQIEALKVNLEMSTESSVSLAETADETIARLTTEIKQRDELLQDLGCPFDPVSDIYTSQPAPVSVVLPDRKPQRITDAYAEGFNACLDKVKELNQ